MAQERDRGQLTAAAGGTGAKKDKDKDKKKKKEKKEKKEKKKKEPLKTPGVSSCFLILYFQGFFVGEILMFGSSRSRCLLLWLCLFSYRY